jgi:3-phosphoshikimate 1-carboxyvinyltransferase
MAELAAQGGIPTVFMWLAKHRHLMVPLSFLSLIVVLVIPLPPAVMDVLISANISLAAVILLTTIYMSRPLEFSVFPALLLGTKTGRWNVVVVGENAEESPYVAMTHQLCAAFPSRGGRFEVEPDASSGSYFWAADWLLWVKGPNKQMEQIVVQHWPASGWQIDAKYPAYRALSEPVSRKLHLGDSIMTHIVVASLNRASQASLVTVSGSQSYQTTRPAPSRIFNDLGRLRLQETERVRALKTQLEKCGAFVVERGDSLEVFSDRVLHGAEIETYNDHRMAMCFAILGLKVPGIRIKNPSCVKKTFPNFFQKLAAPPPAGLGAKILDARDGRRLSGDELFAG